MNINREYDDTGWAKQSCIKVQSKIIKFQPKWNGSTKTEANYWGSLDAGVDSAPLTTEWSSGVGGCGPQVLMIRAADLKRQETAHFWNSLVPFPGLMNVDLLGCWAVNRVVSARIQPSVHTKLGSCEKYTFCCQGRWEFARAHIHIGMEQREEWKANGATPRSAEGVSRFIFYFFILSELVF